MPFDLATAKPVTSGFDLSTARPISPEQPQGPATFGENVAGSLLGRLALGAASPFIGSFQLGANVGDMVAKKFGLDPVVGKAVNEYLAQLDQMKQKGMAAQRIGPETPLSNVDVAGAGGAATSGGLIAGKLPAATSYLGKIAQGTGIGSVAGLTTPVTTGAANVLPQQLQQGGTGAIVGGAIPAVLPPVIGTGKFLYRAAWEPHTEAGQAAIKGRAVLGAAGDKADEVAALLRQNQQIVPGSMPTAGEAAAPASSVGFSGFQRTAQGVPGTSADAYLARSDAQNAARLAQLRTVGQTPEALASAEQARTAAASPLYEAARTGGNVVNAAPVVDKIDLILSKNPGNRELVSELGNIKAGLTDQAGNVRTDAQEVSSVVDGLKASIAKKDNAFIKGQLTSIKDDLVNSIPGYAQAQAVFKAKSALVNQMQIGQYLENKLVPATSDTAKQRASVYANAIEAATATIKRATDGSARYQQLTQVLNPEQMKAVNSVRDDLARGARFEDMAKLAGKQGPSAMSAATESMQEQTGGPIPAFLKRSLMIAHTIMDRSGGIIDKKVASQIATEMLNPPAVAETIAQAQARETRNKVIASVISNMRNPAIVGLSQQVNKDKQAGSVVRGSAEHAMNFLVPSANAADAMDTKEQEAYRQATGSNIDATTIPQGQPTIRTEQSISHPPPNVNGLAKLLLKTGRARTLQDALQMAGKMSASK